MAFDGKTSHQASMQDMPKTDWHAKLIEWISLLSIVAFAGLAWKLHEIGDAIKSHDKIVEVWMRHNHANTLVTERALAHLEERQPAKPASEYRLRVDGSGATRPEER